MRTCATCRKFKVFEFSVPKACLNLSRCFLPARMNIHSIILTVLIHNLKTARPTKISIPFLSSLDHLILELFGGFSPAWFSQSARA